MGSDEKLFVREGAAWIEGDPLASTACDRSREIHTIAVEWSIETAVDQIWIIAYRDGESVRELRYANGEGWTKRGKPLPFENTAALSSTRSSASSRRNR